MESLQLALKENGQCLHILESECNGFHFLWNSIKEFAYMSAFICFKNKAAKVNL